MGTNNQLYIGLISGTSIDGVDAALVDMQSGHPRLLDQFTLPYPDTLNQKLHALCLPGDNEIVAMGQADQEVALAFADAVNLMLDSNNIQPDQVIAIGSHGQTIRHHPEVQFPFTLQIGDPNLLAVTTNIDVIADFRRKDITLGGQGAPLVPAFHRAVFADHKNRAVINIGGIANITWLPKSENEEILGFDTGPGNRLMDAWCERHQLHPYDDNGKWAKTGKISEHLLTDLMSHPYIHQLPPKSTGREVFHIDWLDEVLDSTKPDISTEDVQRTLLEYTVQSIKLHLDQLTGLEEVYICGGGAENAALMSALHSACGNIPVKSTSKLGIPPDTVEAMAFAWLAYAHINRIPGNIPSVTGASREAVLGAFFPAH